MKKTHQFILLTLFALPMASVAQPDVEVNRQPVVGVNSIVLQDNVKLEVVPGTETILEVQRSGQVARVMSGVMNMSGNTSAKLYLNPTDGPCVFNVEDGANLTFNGTFDFRPRLVKIHSEDNSRVTINDTLSVEQIDLVSEDNSRIDSRGPINTVEYNIKASDNSHIELQNIIEHNWSDGEARPKTSKIKYDDHACVVILEGERKCDYNSRHGSFITTTDETFSFSSRDLELNWFWGFNNWGNRPFSGFGGVSGDASATHYFMNLGFSFDYPLVSKRHFGIYAGLGLDEVLIHFENPMVNATPTGFQASISSSMVQTTINTMDPDNWDSYYSSAALTVPVTFSFEPWKYDGLCIRLSAIPGVIFSGYLSQRYNSKSVQINASDREIRKQANPFMLDARLTLQYSDFGIYTQVATVPLFKSGFEPLYPVKFGLFWTMSGR